MSFLVGPATTRRTDRNQPPDRDGGDRREQREAHQEEIAPGLNTIRAMIASSISAER